MSTSTLTTLNPNAPGKAAYENVPSLSELYKVILGNETSATAKAASKQKAEEILKMPTAERDNWLAQFKIPGFVSSSHENVKEGGLLPVAESAGNSITEALKSFISSYGIRALEVIGGGLLLLFGLWIVAKRELPKAVPV